MIPYILQLKIFHFIFAAQVLPLKFCYTKQKDRINNSSFSILQGEVEEVKKLKGDKNGSALHHDEASNGADDAEEEEDLDEEDEEALGEEEEGDGEEDIDEAEGEEGEGTFD